MQIKIFSVPIPFSDVVNEELNAFLRSKKVMKVDQEFVSNSKGAFWVFCVRYLDGASFEYSDREKVDYKKLLDEAAFKRFARMRELRKQLSMDEDVPAFAIFKDQELADLAALTEVSIEAMKKIKGIGPKRVDKYGEKFIQAIKNETSGRPDADDPRS